MGLFPQNCSWSWLPKALHGKHQLSLAFRTEEDCGVDFLAMGLLVPSITTVHKQALEMMGTTNAM
jgi:hypothetical protein